MARILGLLAAVAVVLTVVACGGDGESPVAEPGESSAEVAPAPPPTPTEPEPSPEPEQPDVGPQPGDVEDEETSAPSVEDGVEEPPSEPPPEVAEGFPDPAELVVRLDDLPTGFALDEESPYEAGQFKPGNGGRPWIAFHIDIQLFAMVLLSAAVWNNVEIGALVEIEREPDKYDPTVHALMSFFVL